MIIGRGIRFRAIEHDDLPLFVKWFNDPEVLQGVSLFLPMAMWEEEQWFEALADRPPAERPLAIDILNDEDEWIHIGNLGLFAIDERVHMAEAGIAIGEKAYWDQGYGTRAMRLLLKHGFETLNLNRIALRVFAHNQRAIRCYEKVGFVHEGRLRQAHFHEGEYVDILWMSILRHEWDQIKGEA
ncbi:MAG: GNAT family protein [Anaerolineales bacterium]|jgi:RimJ/RimL family protein N-acetyltransferase